MTTDHVTVAEVLKEADRAEESAERHLRQAARLRDAAEVLHSLIHAGADIDRLDAGLLATLFSIEPETTDA